MPPSGGGVLDTIHGRNRMTVDPRVPTIPGRSALDVFGVRRGWGGVKRRSRRFFVASFY